MHIPVLQKEVLKYLDPKPNENFIDATIGRGGHTAAILEKNEPRGKVLGIEIDPELYKKLQAAEIKNQKSKIKNRLILVNDSYINLGEIVQKYNFKPVNPVRGQWSLAKTQRKQTSNRVNGILFDLGMSSWHLEESGRGFSFQRKEPLDMRYNPQNQLTAEKIINYWSKFELEKILKEYGEERFARNIAEEIVSERKIKPIKTTFQLVEIIKKATPGWYHRRRMPRRSRHTATLRGRHPATKTFQALRIAVNDELNNLKRALPQALEVLEPGGRLVIISFHSLEDRIIKNFFREQTREQTGEGLPAPYLPTRRDGSGPAPYQNSVLGSGPKIKILTKKPITASLEEIKINPRSRSAKLRAAIKIEL